MENSFCKSINIKIYRNDRRLNLNVNRKDKKE